MKKEKIFVEFREETTSPVFENIRDSLHAFDKISQPFAYSSLTDLYYTLRNTSTSQCNEEVPLSF